MSDVPIITLRAGSLRCDAHGFRTLARLHAELAEITTPRVQIDCSMLGWMDAHLAAPLITVARHANSRGVRVSLINLAVQIRTILQKNGTLQSKIPDTNNTTLPLTQFSLDDGVKFSIYAKRHLDRKEMPRMTQALRSKFFEGLDELFANSALHSKSTFGLHVTGQFYPASGKLTFSLSDGGIGIDGALLASGKSTLRHEEAINWAMEPYNTTRQGDVPGGLGSKLIRDFVSANGGALTVASRNGFWSQQASNVTKARLPVTFPGTTVVLDILTNDRSLYDFESAPAPSDIW